MDLEEETLDESFFGKGIRELAEMFRDLRKVFRYYFGTMKQPLPGQPIEHDFPSIEEERLAGWYWRNKGYIPTKLFNICYCSGYGWANG